MKLFVIYLFFGLLSYPVLAQIGTSWSNTGPILFPGNVSGQINGIGRCTQMKFDPSDPTKIYVTSASGGLWKSSNSGVQWTNAGTDGFPAVSCASVCIDHSNPNILYLGTGDPNYYGGGYGVYKSTNGGTTWSAATTGISTGLIIELIMDPTNSQTIVAATDNGIYKTTNGGSSWTNVKSGGDFKAMKQKPSDNLTLYAVTSSEIWRSTDFGSTWQQLTNGVTVPGNNGQGMRIAVSDADPQVVYVGMIANEGMILKSTDGGNSFTTVYNNPSQSLVGYDPSSSGQGDYNFAMTCDPTDANTVYVVAHVVWKSTDGGVNWTQLTNWWEKCHTDMHGIIFQPGTSNLFDMNDGGVFISIDGGSTWSAKSDGIAATEIYHGAQSMLTRNMVDIGTQDNGELYFSGNIWNTNRGGDWGSHCLFDYLTNDVVYYLDAGTRRTIEGGSENSLNLPFTASSSTRMDFNRKLPNLAISGLQDMYLTTDLSSNPPAWTQIYTGSSTLMAIHSSLADSAVVYAFNSSNTLLRCDNIFAATPAFTSLSAPSSTNLYASIATVANNDQVVYVSCGTHVYRSPDKGQTFVNISTGLPAGVNIIKILHDEFSTDETIYLATAKGVYYRNNTMSSWQNISLNLPTIADIQDLMFYNPGNAGSVLRVDYYGRGVWELPVNTSAPPTVDFVASNTVICPNNSIQFTDLSYSSNTITGYQWSFPGGTPSTSTQTSPTVTYPSSGIYSASLTVTDANGNASLTKTSYIQVIAPHVLPQSEGFESASFPQEWSLFDDGNDGVVWELYSGVGGQGSSSKCIYFDNFNNDISGKRDELWSENYELTDVLSPSLSFDVAYAPYGGANVDTLAVLISMDCGQTFNEIYLKGNTTLATAPADQNEFVPTSSQWRTETIDLSPYIGQPKVLFAFQNRGRYGNNIYLDNINVNGTSTAGVKTLENNEFLFSLFPNPASNQVEIVISSKNPAEYNIEIVDLSGKLVQQYSPGMIHDKKSITLDVSKLDSGIYEVRLQSASGYSTRKLIVE